MQMSLFKRSAVSLALAAAAFYGGTAQAGVVTLDIAGISSNGEFGDSSNETRFIDILAGVRITGLSWNVFLRTAKGSPSWLSEIGVDLNDGAFAGVALFPGFGSDLSGAKQFEGSADLVSLGFDFNLGATGRLNFEFFESFDDVTNAADAYWDRGTVTVTYVPEPATYGLVGLALLGVGLSTRRLKS